MVFDAISLPNRGQKFKAQIFTIKLDALLEALKEMLSKLNGRGCCIIDITKGDAVVLFD